MRTPLFTQGATRGGPRLESARVCSPRGAAIATAALSLLLSLACKPGTDPSAGPEEATSVRDEESGLDDPTAEEPAEAEDGESDAEGEPASGSRVPLVDEDHDQYAQVEGTNFENSCDTDADCHEGGCSSEICSADPGVSSACVMPAGGWASEGGSCGCLEGTCTWYTVEDEDAEQDSGASAGEGDDESAGEGDDESAGEGDDESAGEGDDEDGSKGALPGQGESCDDGECSEPLSCVTYYGVAGPQGPEFSSCEIRCPRGKVNCPDGQTCVTIADGPGRVCRAR